MGMAHWWWRGRGIMICAACQNGVLEQKYPSSISCNSCGSKWTNMSLGSGNPGRKSYYAAKYKEGRKF